MGHGFRAASDLLFVKIYLQKCLTVWLRVWFSHRLKVGAEGEGIGLASQREAVLTSVELDQFDLRCCKRR